MFDSQAMLADLKLWVEHETPTSQPDAVNRLSNHIEQQFRALGAACERTPGRDGYGDHLLVESPWGGNGGAVVMLCHIDTVHPIGTLQENPFRIEGDKAYGPGIYDMKGGAYLAYSVYRALAGKSLHNQRKLQVLYTSDEEVGSPSSRALIQELAANASAVLVVEPAREGGKVVVARRGVARYVARFRGRPAHSGSKHQDGRSAIKEMARQILDWEAMTDYGRNLSVNVGMVEGGTAFNVVPEQAAAYVDIRVPNPDVTADAIARFEASKAYDPDVTMTLTGGLNRPAMPHNPATEALFDRAAPIALRHGFTLEGMMTGGGSDGNFTYDKAPTLDGLGVDGDGAHTKWEHIRISSLVERVGFLLDLASDLLEDD